MTTLHRAKGMRLFAILLLLTALGATTVVGEVGAQDRVTVQVDENLRAEPQGTIIGRLPIGSVFDVLRTDGRWVQIEVKGWIWTRSVQIDSRQGFDLRVSATDQENLRAEASGTATILARLLEGALLEKLNEVPGWTEVRREAWVWGPSVNRGSPDRPGTSENPLSPTEAPSPAPASGEGEGWWRSGPGGAPVLTGPDGDTLARARPGTELQVLARQGNWVRVRLEGWSWAPMGETADSTATSIVSSLTPEDVARDPERYRGQVVDWELQFISRETAERIRTDFYVGEPFLLARAAAPERAYVYVAVPPERLAEVEGLIPLERIRVVGRIRTGAAALTGNPILDLLELTRISGI